MAVGQAIFQRQLEHNLGDILPEDAVTKIIDSGVTDLSSLVDPSMLREAVDIYSLSVTQIFVSPEPSTAHTDSGIDHTHAILSS